VLLTQTLSDRTTTKGLGASGLIPGLWRRGEGEGAGREAVPDTTQPVTVPLQKRLINLQLSLVAQSRPTLCDIMDCTPRPPCPSPTPGACSNSCPLSR